MKKKSDMKKKFVAMHCGRWFLPFCEDVAVGREGSFVAAMP